MAKSTAQPPWKHKRPSGTRKTSLSPKSKDTARKRAAAAGRRYPNLVDNMRAAAEQKAASKTKKRTTHKTKRSAKNR